MALFKYDATNNKLVPITSEGNIGIPVGAVMSFAQGTQSPNWLLCDGRDTTGTAEELRTHYPALYTYLGGTNVLPDYRECVLVGVGQNDTDTIAEHDVYTLGEFKDDQLQDHTHDLSTGLALLNDYAAGASADYAKTNTCPPNEYVTKTSTVTNTYRTGTTTHGKQKGVAFYIKATSAGIEVDKDLYATKGYIRDQNILSEWEDITLPTTAATAITMDYDGFIYFDGGIPQGTHVYIYINGVSFEVGESGASAGGNNVTNYIPVKKGDVIYVSRRGRSRVAYYKLRDYTGR